MRILLRSVLYSLLLFIAIFLISSTIILYFSLAEAESISEIGYFSFWIAIPFFIFMSFSIYFIINNKENKKSFWKRFAILISIIIFLALIFYIIFWVISYDPNNPEGAGFAFLFLIVFPAIFLAISFILTMLYKFLYRYNEKTLIYLPLILISVSIILIVISLILLGGCLSGDTNCYSKKAIEEGNIEICKSAYPGGICERIFYEAQSNESVCEELVDAEDEGIYLKSQCYSHFANKNNNPSLCRYDNWSRSGCCSIVFGASLNELSGEQKSDCGII